MGLLQGRRGVHFLMIEVPLYQSSWMAVSTLERGKVFEPVARPRRNPRSREPPFLEACMKKCVDYGSINTLIHICLCNYDSTDKCVDYGSMPTCPSCILSRGMSSRLWRDILRFR